MLEFLEAVLELGDWDMGCTGDRGASDLVGAPHVEQDGVFPEDGVQRTRACRPSREPPQQRGGEQNPDADRDLCAHLVSCVLIRHTSIASRGRALGCVTL